ncbi:tRNA (adenosine(37)-N6)-dimethylallyltransferase MiaA [Candidatus Kaiserbacteria bacterium]|nr:tRNA (adenosine(37)-N6)-dimethylallyltransferase MiaA [Candidatus Kaiserbacteria bacterium]
MGSSPTPGTLKKRKLLIIVGPTSSGKSALAVELARKFDGEVISADSRQVYRGLDIGTGKITKREMKGVPHHLMDIASPKRVFTAHDFMEKARAAIQEIASRGKLPIVAGGTGFYIDILVGNVLLPDVPAHLSFRRSVINSTTVELFMQLKKVDPARAKTIDPHNKRRIIRALEVALALGKNPKPGKALVYDALWIGIDIPKKKLNRKIRERLAIRLRRGMAAEAGRLHEGGLSYKRMEALGLEYHSLARFLQKKISRSQLEEELARDITRYAKRQMTYWRRNKKIQWFKPSEARAIRLVVRSWIRPNF